MTSSRQSLPITSPSMSGDSYSSQKDKEFLDLPVSGTIRRRKFLGISFLSLLGIGLPQSSKGSEKAVDKLVTNELHSATDLYKKQTDSFEEKIKLIQEAWSKKDFRLVRALSDSIRNTGIQAQVEEENPGTPLLSAGDFKSVASLPVDWQSWANGWKYFKCISLEEKAGEKRISEPVEVLLSFPADQVGSLFREIRVAEVNNGQLTEVVSQVFGEVRRGAEKFCKVMFLADNNGGEKRNYLVFYGNPDAEIPKYTSDLKVRGEGYQLEIENEFFTAYLSKQHGQLERMTLKREHGVELYAGGPGHGEPPGIDWAHDYVTEDNFQKVRMTYWGECPDFEVVKGPICTIIRRWGFPHSAVHPIYTPL